MDNRADASQAVARSNLYGLLSRITCSEVDAQLLGELRKEEVLGALRELGVDLAQALTGEIEAVALEQLATAYTYLFLMTVNPHESVQRGEGKLWGDHTVAANNFLEEVGLAVTGETSLLPDHISMELAVMQRLTADEAMALEAGDSERAAEVEALQKRYLKEHLGAWGVQFFGAAEKAANHDFYRGISRLGRDFLLSELEAFGLS